MCDALALSPVCFYHVSLPFTLDSSPVLSYLWSGMTSNYSITVTALSDAWVRIPLKVKCAPRVCFSVLCQAQAGDAAEVVWNEPRHMSKKLRKADRKLFRITKAHSELKRLCNRRSINIHSQPDDLQGSSKLCMFVLDFLCCAVLCRCVSCYGLIACATSPTKCFNWFITSEVILNWNRPIKPNS